MWVQAEEIPEWAGGMRKTWFDEQACGNLYQPIGWEGVVRPQTLPSPSTPPKPLPCMVR